MSFVFIGELFMKTLICVFAILSAFPASAFAQYVGVMKGTIHGAIVTYKNSTEVRVTSGYGETNKSYWEISSYVDVDLSAVLPSGPDYVYIYIDDSASVYPAPTIIGSTDEPVWADEKQGWYRTTTGNEGDRCIGAVWSPSGSATILEFTSYEDAAYIVKDAETGIAHLIDGGNPDGSLQSISAADYTPVNAVGAYSLVTNSNSGDYVIVGVCSADNTVQCLVTSGHSAQVHIKGWLQFEKNGNRDLVWFGEDNDNNAANFRIYGYKLNR